MDNENIEQVQNEQQIVNQESQPQDQPKTITTPQNQEIDISGYLGEDGNFDSEKIRSLVKERDTHAKSEKFFKQKYTMKESIPEKPEDYFADFSPDSSYDKFLSEDAVKDTQSNLAKWAKDNHIGKANTQKFFDFIMRQNVSVGNFDTRSQAEIEHEQLETQKKFDEEVEPLLKGLNRTKDENSKIISNFLNGRNIFTSNPEIKEFLHESANTDPRAYKLVTMMIENLQHGNVPIVSGTIATKDLTAFRDAISKELNPEKREIMMKEFYNKGDE